MYEIIEVMAKIELFVGAHVRQTPFSKGYRPLFNFKNAGTKLSGKIDLIDKIQFAPGETDVVKIAFIKGMIDNNYFNKGIEFTFDEGVNTLGKGEIIEVLR